MLASSAIITYAEGAATVPELDHLLRWLARPLLRDWWEFVRRLVPALAEAGDAGFRDVSPLIIGRGRTDLPRVAALGAALAEALGLAARPSTRVRVSDLYDR